jgi:hypothetical protein
MSMRNLLIWNERKQVEFSSVHLATSESFPGPQTGGPATQSAYRHNGSPA